MKITKKWHKSFGFWQFSCGCLQYQDGYDYCKKHKKKGYISLLKDMKK